MESVKSNLLAAANFLYAKRVVHFVLLALCAFTAFYSLLNGLLEQNFAPENLVYFGEKAQIALRGVNPKFENLFFITPILPYTLTLIMGDPFIMAALVGSIGYTSLLFCLYRLYEKQQISAPVCLVILLYITFSPSFLFIYLMAPNRLILYALLILSIYFLRRYYAERLSSQLFMFGLSFGIFCQNLIQTPWAWFICLPALVAITYSQNRPQFPIFVAAYFPTFVFITAPPFLAFIFFGHINMNTIFQTPLETYRIAPNANISMVLTFEYLLIVLKGFALMLLPYWIFWLRIPQFEAKTVFITFLIIPLLFLIVRIHEDTFYFSSSQMTLFILFSILLFTRSFGLRFETNKWISLLLIGAYSVSFVANIIIETKSTDAIERGFIRAFFGLPVEPILKDAQTIARYLKKNPGTILADDDIAYPVVYFVDDPKRFILPYRNAFATVLSQPNQFVDYILTSQTPEHDLILKVYPEAIRNEIENFQPILKSGKYTLFAKNRSP